MDTEFQLEWKKVKTKNWLGCFAEGVKTTREVIAEIQANVRRKYRGNRLCFELSRVDCISWVSWNRAEKKAKVLKKVYARGKIIKQSFENVRMYEELGGFYPTLPKDNSILYLYNSSHHDQPHLIIDDYPPRVNCILSFSGMFVVTEVSRVSPPFESQFRVVFQLIVLHFLKYQTACRFFGITVW